MSEFLSPVHLQPVGFDQWQVLNRIAVYSEPLEEAGFDPILIIEPGFVCDLDSIPRWVPVLYALLKGRAVRESVPHDLLYRRSGIPRLVADKVMLDLMAAEGQPEWVRSSIYGGVRSFGWAAYRRKNPDAQAKGNDDELPDDGPRDSGGPGA